MEKVEIHRLKKVLLEMRPVEGGFGLGCGLVQCSIVLFLEVVLLDGGIVELNARVLTDRRAFMFRDLTKDYT